MAIDYVHPKRQRKIILTAGNPVAIIQGNADECECLPGLVCPSCAARGYRNGLAGYAARLYPARVTQDDIDEQDRADRALDQ